jgi:hypothetical protein
MNYASSAVASIYGDIPSILDQCMALVGEAGQLSLIQGHIPHGTHRLTGQESANYYFFLRDPVCRHFSDVIHGLDDTEHGFHRLINESGGDFATLAKISDQCIYYRNTMTHYLSGAFFSKELDLIDVQRATRAIVEGCFVGIAERFNESILLMAKRLGWKHILYEKRNVSSRHAAMEIPDTARQACESRLSYDRLLYRIACERFEKDVAAYGQHLREAAEQLQNLVDIQQQKMPGLQNKTYMIGDPIPTATLSRAFSADSPLGRWLG